MDAKTDTTKKTGSIILGNKSLDFPVYDGSVGPSVVDISKLYAESGMFTYDPGFTSTASCESKITYIDGDEGILLYRGYPIEQLAEHGDFLETCYLLLYGELPTPSQKADFDYRVTRHTMVHEQMSRFFQGFRRDAHPMAVMTGSIGALSAFYHDSTDHLRSGAAHDRVAAHDRQGADARCHGRTNIRSASRSFIRRTISTTPPTSCACATRCRPRSTSRTRCWRAPWTASSSCMRTTSRTPRPRRCGSPVRPAPIPSPVSPPGCACLWGPAHGGANEAALNMLREIGTVDRIPEFVKRAKDKNDSYRLMGFGHRVYKNYDPRAKIMQKTCHEVLNELGIKDDPLLDVAMELEKIALHDEYFIEKKLYPNIDFYSGITLKAMGFPTTMFTVLFAVARTVGWIAQWKEMIEDPKQKIGRPRQLYTGATNRDYIPDLAAENSR